jgi:uncharacterized Zn finger protein
MPITEAAIRSLASAQSFERGEDYYHSGTVYELQKRGDTLTAEVEGSSYAPYRVTIEFAGDQIISTDCTCPYDWGGDCKHIVAVLLAYLHQPDQVTERPPLDELLADLGQEELLDLLTDLLSKHPHLIDWVEGQLATRTAPVDTSQPGQPRQRQIPLDPESFRKQAQYIMNSSDMDYWGGSSEAVGEIRDVVDKAIPFIEAGDGRNALLILEPVTEVFVNHWFEVDHDGDDSAMLFADLGTLFAEAILSSDLSVEERQALAEKLSTWQGEIENYGLDEGFGPAIGAAEHGWEYPPLQKVLQGHITNKGAWEDEAPWYADDLAVARLNVLERQGRTTEYLYLAEAEGQTALYLTMLVKLGRPEEAVEYALQYMATTDEALALAQALREHNQPAEALKIAEHGLTLQGQRQTLARWLRDFAAQLSQLDVALKAARGAFADSFSLENYQAAEAIAGEKWPSVKAELLDQLAAANFAYGRIDIYLYEDMVDEAIEAIDKQGYVGYYTLEPVVEAAWQSHPDWVIRQCKNQAERIMDAGQSKNYHHAIRWLERARRAYLGAERTEEWRSYLESLISKHARKYSLRPQLEGLRDVGN